MYTKSSSADFAAHSSNVSFFLLRRLHQVRKLRPIQFSCGMILDAATKAPTIKVAQHSFLLLYDDNVLPFYINSQILESCAGKPLVSDPQSVKYATWADI